MREAVLTDAALGFNGEFWICRGYLVAEVTGSNPVGCAWSVPDMA
jgi:hypothetical protein